MHDAPRVQVDNPREELSNYLFDHLDGVNSQLLLDLPRTDFSSTLLVKVMERGSLHELHQLEDVLLVD